MSDDPSGSTFPADFKKIMDCIEDVTRSAPLNQQSRSNFLQFGPVTTELQHKLINLKDMLDEYVRKQGR